VQLI
jgi:hypothetical protein